MKVVHKGLQCFRAVHRLVICKMMGMNEGLTRSAVKGRSGTRPDPDLDAPRQVPIALRFVPLVATVELSLSTSNLSLVKTDDLGFARNLFARKSLV
jgi:hypothetical protein